MYTIQQQEVLLSTEITSGLNESDYRTHVYIKVEKFRVVEDALVSAMLSLTAVHDTVNLEWEICLIAL